MKRIAFFCFLAIVTAGGCKPTASFKTPNDVYKKQGIVYLVNGVQKEGNITIKFGGDHEQSPYVLLNTDNGEEKFLPDSVKSYSIDGNFFFPKAIDLYFDGTKRILFVKRITKESSRIQLYELFQEAKETVDGLNDNYYYFISLPGQARLETWNTASKKLVPDFNLKMSIQVKDCPALAEKIMAKQKGYFLAQFTLAYSTKVEVLKRIIEEYNNCR